MITLHVVDFKPPVLWSDYCNKDFAKQDGCETLMWINDIDKIWADSNGHSWLRKKNESFSRRIAESLEEVISTFNFLYAKVRA